MEYKAYIKPITFQAPNLEEANRILEDVMSKTEYECYLIEEISKSKTKGKSKKHKRRKDV